jgi:signal transduction histidine kinase
MYWAKFIFLLYAFFYCLLGFAHDVPKVDSLRRVLTTSLTDSLKVVLLSNLASEIQQTSPADALEYAQQAIVLARKHTMLRHLVECMQTKGIIYYQQEHYPFALHYLLESLEIANQMNYAEAKINAFKWISRVYAKQNNFNQSLDYANQQLHTAEVLRDRRETARALMNVALIYLDQNNIQKSVYFFHKAIPIFKTLGEQRHLADAYINLANVYMSQKNFAKALELCKEAHQIYQQLDWQKGIILTYQNYGEIYLAIGDYHQAIQYYQAATALQDTIQDNIGKVYTMNQLATTFLAAKRLTDAMITAQNSLFLAQRLEELGGMRDAYATLYLIFKKKGEPVKALYFYELERKISDSIFNEERDRLLMVMHKNYEVEKHQEKVYELTEHKEQQDLELAKQILIRNILFFSFLGISVLSFFLLKSNVQKKHINQKLIQKNDEIAHINQALEEKVAEIARMNQELEEKVAERTAELAKTIEKLSEQNHDLAEFAHIVSHQLRQPLARAAGLLNVMELSSPDLEYTKLLRLSLEGLDKVIHHLNEILQVKNSITQHYEVIDLTEELNKVLHKQLGNDLIENEVNLVVENALVDGHILSVRKYINSILYHLVSNTIKYKDPVKPLTVQIRLTEPTLDTILIQVQDNGLGIPDVNKLFRLYQRQHFHVEGIGLGLYLVQTQLKVIGGTISVESEQGKGATFEVLLKRG